MTIIPVKFRSFCHPLGRTGKLEIERWAKERGNYRTYTVKWSGFPAGRVAQIVAVAVYANQTRQQVNIMVDGSRQGSGSIMFPGEPETVSLKVKGQTFLESSNVTR